VLIFVAFGLVVGWILAIPAYQALDRVVAENIPPELDYREVFHNLTGGFMLRIKMALYISLALTMPFTLYQVWAFIAPGLKKQERKPVLIVTPISVLLFATGVWLAWMVIPQAVKFLSEFVLQFEGPGLYQEAGTMVFFLTKLMLAFGIAFQLPILVFFLGKIGLMSADSFLAHWRQATLIIFVSAAILTPPDMITQILMGVPMTLLYVGSALVLKFTERKQARASELDDLD
jgi:sec-independent protein translocase protein TatC